MGEFEEKEQEDLMRDIEWEKRERKILLICSAVCSALGLIIGVISGVSWYGDLEGILTSTFGGLWVGTGVGVAIRACSHYLIET